MLKTLQTISWSAKNVSRETEGERAEITIIYINNLRQRQIIPGSYSVFTRETERERERWRIPLRIESNQALVVNLNFQRISFVEKKEVVNS